MITVCIYSRFLQQIFRSLLLVLNKQVGKYIFFVHQNSDIFHDVVKFDCTYCIHVLYLVEAEDPDLMSFEKLDRASPDLWPEQSEYMCRKNYDLVWDSVMEFLVKLKENE